MTVYSVQDNVGRLYYILVDNRLYFLVDPEKCLWEPSAYMNLDQLRASIPRYSTMNPDLGEHELETLDEQTQLIIYQFLLSV